MTLFAFSFMKFILAKKLEMSQRFKPDGTAVAVTLLKADRATVTDVKTLERDGYAAVQLGVGEKKKQVRREFRVRSIDGYALSAPVDVSIFAPGDLVAVVGTSKGRGFQGVVKRHGFHGHPASHGHKDQLRMPGSIGSKRQGPVAKGKRMAGRMGADRVTVKNLEVIEVDAEKKILAVKGAVPGARGTLILVSSL